MNSRPDRVARRLRRDAQIQATASLRREAVKGSRRNDFALVADLHVWACHWGARLWRCVAEAAMGHRMLERGVPYGVDVRG